MVQIIFVKEFDIKKVDDEKLKKYIKNLKYKINAIDNIYSANNIECIIAAKILLFHNDKNKVLKIIDEFTKEESIENSIINELITKLNYLREDDENIEYLKRGKSEKINLKEREKFKEKLVKYKNALIFLPESYMEAVDQEYNSKNIKLLDLQSKKGDINIITFEKKEGGDYDKGQDIIRRDNKFNVESVINFFKSGVLDNFNFENKESDSDKRNKIAKNIFIIFMILLLLGGGGYTGYRVIKGGKKSKKKKKYL